VEVDPNPLYKGRSFNSGGASMDRSAAAAYNMRKGFNCAQSIVKAFSSELTVDEQAAVKMAASLGAGLGRNGYVCGALSGAALVIGARYGNTDPADTAGREKAYAVANELLEKFQRENHTVLCRELISFNLKNPDELKRAREMGVFQNRCPLFVLSAGKILEEILASS
jgi:C_GCAxxG_C_C family probable redox protein